MNTIKLVLVKIRKDRNLLSQEVAKRLGVSKGEYSVIENGISAPFPGFVARLTNALNLSQNERAAVQEMIVDNPAREALAKRRRISTLLTYIAKKIEDGTAQQEDLDKIDRVFKILEKTS